jgi:hypothetical protein
MVLQVAKFPTRTRSPPLMPAMIFSSHGGHWAGESFELEGEWVILSVKLRGVFKFTECHPVMDSVKCTIEKARSGPARTRIGS